MAETLGIRYWKQSVTDWVDRQLSDVMDWIGNNFVSYNLDLPSDWSNYLASNY